MNAAQLQAHALLARHERTIDSLCRSYGRLRCPQDREEFRQNFVLGVLTRFPDFDAEGSLNLQAREAAWLRWQARRTYKEMTRAQRRDVVPLALDRYVGTPDGDDGEDRVSRLADEALPPEEALVVQDERAEGFCQLAAVFSLATKSERTAIAVALRSEGTVTNNLRRKLRRLGRRLQPAEV